MGLTIDEAIDINAGFCVEEMDFTDEGLNPKSPSYHECPSCGALSVVHVNEAMKQGLVFINEDD